MACRRESLDSLEILINLLSKKSITPDEAGCFDYICSLLPEFSAVRVDFDGDDSSYAVKNLWLSKKFGNGAHIAFAGHVDVVPAGNGWDSEPFNPVLKDGYIYARGAQDMKSGVAAFVAAAMALERGEIDFNGTISLILTSDEEGEGTHGTLHVLKFLKERGELPDFAIVAEPTCESVLGDSLKVGRRGSINGRFSIIGKQGHAAYPAKCLNPAHALAPLFSKLAGVDLDSGSEFFAPSKLVITDIRGGMQVTNVTPERVDVMFNVRNSNLTDANKVEQYIKGVLNELEDGFGYELSLRAGSLPFLTDKDSMIVKAMQSAVKEVLDIESELNTKGGTSDARYLSAFGVPCVEFGVINDRIHAVNERVSKAEMLGLTEVFKRVLGKFKG